MPVIHPLLSALAASALMRPSTVETNLMPLPISKKTNPAGLTPAEYALAEFHRIRRANSKGGRNAWKNLTSAERAAEMKKRRKETKRNMVL